MRFIDENIARGGARMISPGPTPSSSAACTSSAARCSDICARAHAAGKPVALGGPSVSACPEFYPEFDYLHIGELGDATDALIDLIAASIDRPAGEQIALETKERRALADFPTPAYELAAIDRYFLGSIQFSSGCPYTCEFCDIPGLYGRVPRLKTPQQIVAELDKLLRLRRHTARSISSTTISSATARALRDLLPHLVEWQKQQRLRRQLLLRGDAQHRPARRKSSR